ncbi:hypothetical protein VIGAN_05195000, partial [Vigna angularis var. angularis]
MSSFTQNERQRLPLASSSRNHVLPCPCCNVVSSFLFHFFIHQAHHSSECSTQTPPFAAGHSVFLDLLLDHEMVHLTCFLQYRKNMRCACCCAGLEVLRMCREFVLVASHVLKNGRHSWTPSAAAHHFYISISFSFQPRHVDIVWYSSREMHSLIFFFKLKPKALRFLHHVLFWKHFPCMSPTSNVFVFLSLFQIAVLVVHVIVHFILISKCPCGWTVWHVFAFFLGVCQHPLVES